MTKPKDAARKAAERYFDNSKYKLFTVSGLARLLRDYGKREYSRGIDEAMEHRETCTQCRGEP